MSPTRVPAMSSNAEIAERLHHFALNIERWRTEAARLTLQVSEARQNNAKVEELVALEETATEIYADVSARQPLPNSPAWVTPSIWCCSRSPSSVSAFTRPAPDHPSWQAPLSPTS
jgi:hypothetical protein